MEMKLSLNGTFNSLDIYGSENMVSVVSGDKQDEKTIDLKNSSDSFLPKRDYFRSYAVDKIRKNVATNLDLELSVPSPISVKVALDDIYDGDATTRNSDPAVLSALLERIAGNV